ncbi:MAG TPA: type II secretion system protein GspC [Candidatus Binataceae bacterium]|nr:type II secretion system protein GspC [Candidatus Binataceae bacterium]
MGFNLSDRYITFLNFLLVGAIVYCLALAVSGAAKLHFADGSEMGPSKTAQPVSPAKSAARPRTRTDYETIVRRDIFDLAPPPPPAPAVHDETINVTLLGTSHFGRRGAYAIIESPNGEQELYRIGETIPNVGRLLAVGPDRAIVLHNGRRVVITIPSGYSVQPENVRPFRGPIRRPFINNPMMRRRHMMGANDGVRKLAANHYLLRRAVVNSNLQNMSRLFTEIRAVPKMQNGASSGFQLSEIQPGSIFQQIGLQDGDVLTAAQGQPVNDPLKAMQLLQTLRNQSSITLNVIRDGAPLQIQYNIQ